MAKLRIYSLGYKGFKVIEKLISIYGNQICESVIIGQDTGIQNDYSNELCQLCQREEIKHLFKKNFIETNYSGYAFAIGWRWLVDTNKVKDLIIFHDSILPKYRGFNPLVTALINGDKEIGVTALFTSKSYDKGNIIEISKQNINYPIRVQEAILKITDNYIKLSVSVTDKILAERSINSYPQDESFATYSLWRDEIDYHIDWRQNSNQIRRFVDAVGYPYKGAFSIINGEKVRILEVEEETNLNISNRTPGKVIFFEEGFPVVVCGDGLIKVKKMIRDEDGHILKLNKFRIRFE